MYLKISIRTVLMGGFYSSELLYFLFSNDFMLA